MKIQRDRPEPTKRKAMTPARRLRVFNAASGRCQCGCSEKLRPDWEVEHRIPLSIGGTEDDSNLEAWNAVCHQRKTSGEAGPRAKVARIIAREDGTRRPRKPIPARADAWPKGRKIPTKKDRRP